MKNQLYSPTQIINTAGQWTPIINQRLGKARRAQIGQKLLARYPQAGQVAYVYQFKNTYQVNMMGDELSINGAIAGCYYLLKQLKRKQIDFYTSRVNSRLSGTINGDFTTVQFPRSIIRSSTSKEVVLSGIKYRFINSSEPTIQQARLYCGQDPAAGFILSPSPDSILPIVYVRATNTLTTETACGSASLAYFLQTGCSQILQPSSQIISINQTNNCYLISAPVTIIKERMLK